jgi:hypothetical protein
MMTVVSCVADAVGVDMAAKNYRLPRRRWLWYYKPGVLQATTAMLSKKTAEAQVPYTFQPTRQGKF